MPISDNTINIINMIFGIINVIVAIISIIVGIIGKKSLNEATKIANLNHQTQNAHGDIVKQTQINNNGMKPADVIDIMQNITKPYSGVINNLKDLQNVLAKNSRYAVPVVWCGIQEEYDKLEHKDDGVYYMVREK